MRAGEIYINPASGERAVVILGTDEPGGRRVVIDLYLRPGGGTVGSQYHPHIHERFKVIESRVSFTLDGVEQSAEPGQTVDIPPGTLHSFWNTGSSEGLIRFEVQPAARFVAQIKNGFSLAQDGKTDHTGKFERKSLMYVDVAPKTLARIAHFNDALPLSRESSLN